MSVANRISSKFHMITWYQSVSERYQDRNTYSGLDYLPTLFIHDQELVGSIDIENMIDGVINTAYALGTDIQISGTAGAGGTNGTVTNLSGNTLTNLMIFAFGYEEGLQNDHAYNTVRDYIGEQSVPSLGGSASVNYNFPAPDGAWKVIICVFDNTTKVCLNCFVLN